MHDDLDLWKARPTGVGLFMIAGPASTRAIDSLAGSRKRAHIEEAHFIYRAGMGHYSLAAFQVALS